MTNIALLIIDVQNDYFTGGKMELPGAEQAASNTRRILDNFRENGLPIFHIQHESVKEGSTFFLPGTDGQKIHKSVEPIAKETVIVKNWPNSFHETELLQCLKDHNIKKLVITGMMTFMCVDATTRAAKDLGFECILIHDSTASPALEFDGVSCSAEQVKAAFTCALAHISDKVVSTEEFFED